MQTHPRTVPSGSRRELGGFTLVEVMVALLIMAVMAGLAWRGMDSIARTRSVTEGRMEQAVRVDAVLGQWEQDLLAIQDTPNVPALTFDGASLRLVRRTENGLQLVAWSVRDGHWLRWTSPPATRAAALQDSWIRSQQLIGNEPGQLRTLEGVATWQVYFYRGNAWTNAQSSGDFAEPAQQAIPQPPPKAPSQGATPNGTSADPQATPPAKVVQRQLLPTGVRLVISFQGALNGTLTRDVLLGPQS